MDKQRVWRTLSESKNGAGYFIWDVIESDVEEGNATPASYFTKCSDSSYIMIMCYHFWTKEKAEEFLLDNEFDTYQTVIVI